MKNCTVVKTRLAVGKTKNYFYAEGKSINMHDNTPFEKEYSNVESFIKDFTPEKPSENLLSAIRREFVNKSGRVVFKPIGYKSNQTFYFNAQN